MKSNYFDILAKSCLYKLSWRAHGNKGENSLWTVSISSSKQSHKCLCQ